MWDWAVTNYYHYDHEIKTQLELLSTIAPYNLTFWIGQFLFALVPGFILLMAKRIKNFRVLMLAAIGPLICAVLLRWNYNFSGLIASITYDPFSPTVQLNSYVPTWQEWFVGIGVISYWLLGFSLVVLTPPLPWLFDPQRSVQGSLFEYHYYGKPSHKVGKTRRSNLKGV
jgi:Ni/Fe-hydrogenase subunit HybB-like protein